MECYCDYDGPTVYRQTARVARKTHVCSECGHAAIRPGQTYQDIFGVWDGEISTFKRCKYCDEFLSYVTAHVPCFCWYHGNIVDGGRAELREYDHEAPGLYFGGLRILAKARIAARAGATQ